MSTKNLDKTVISSIMVARIPQTGFDPGAGQKVGSFYSKYCVNSNSAEERIAVMSSEATYEEQNGCSFQAEEHLVYQGGNGSLEFGRIQNQVGERLVVRKGGAVKVISKIAVVGRRYARSFSGAVGQDEEFIFHGQVSLWYGGKEYRGRIVDVPRSGECLVEFRDESGSRRLVERFQDELVILRKPGRGNEKRSDEKSD